MSARAVPCGSCTTCCRGGELIVLHPEDGDRVETYRTQFAINPLTGRRVRVLRQTAAGDCVYLGDRGCSIYDRRPAICRGFDCRDFLRRYRARCSVTSLLAAMRNNPVLQAAARLQASSGERPETLPLTDPDTGAVRAAPASAPKGRPVETSARGHKPETATP